MNTAPVAQPRGLDAARSLPLGVSQIYLQDSWMVGVLMIVGFAVYSIPMALLVVVGTVIATASAHVVGKSIGHGLQGYCGALVGAAAWTTFGELWPAFLVTLVGAAACPVVTGALAAFFSVVRRQGGPLPVLTAPFCVVSGLVALTARALVEPAPAGAPIEAGNTALQLLEGTLAGIGQVVFCQSWLSGLIILGALFLAGWKVGAAALLGSALGTATMWAAGSTPAELSAGLAGYNPALTAIALAAVFLRPGPRAWMIATLGSIVTVGVCELLKLTPIPVYTWPFILVTWLCLLIWDGERQ
ncbi:MAG: urea transporter [Ancrocorticia sp.]